MKDYIYNAYDKNYLSRCMENMGVMLDYACIDNHYNPDTFFRMFIDCGLAKQIERGNVFYIAGKSGIELADEVFSYYKIDTLFEPRFDLDKSDIYWCGWVLAYYQWLTNKTFIGIWEHISINTLQSLYYPYHEADITKIVEIIDGYFDRYKKSSIQELRLAKGLTQKELAKRASMDISQIQRLEYGERKTENLTLKTAINLANALGVDIKQL